MHHITTPDKTTLYVKDWGAGDAVILLSGWPLSADSWDDQALVLADDLATVIAQTGAQNATLVGFSMGGGEVARYMSRHGGKSVVKAALVSSVVPCMLQSPDNPEGTEQAVFDTISIRIREDRAQFFAGFFKDFFGVGVLSHPVSTELVDWARGMAMQASLRATLECAKSFASTDFRGDLEAFGVPTLIIHGTADKTVPIAAAGRAAHAGIEQSTLLEYEGAPHGLFATHKQRLSEDLLSFIRR